MHRDKNVILDAILNTIFYGSGYMIQAPKRICLSPAQELIIDWTDGFVSRIPIDKLRRGCPCATCREENEKPSDPFRVLKPKELEPLRLVRMDTVGRYAYKITWSDGHDTGIFSIEYLRAFQTSN